MSVSVNVQTNLVLGKDISYKKELRRIDWKTVKRIVKQLYYNKEKKTNLAMKCNLSYDKFMLYLNWMDMLGLIYHETDEQGYELLNLNNKGIDLFTKISDA